MIIIIESLLTAVALSIDAFAIGLSYGIREIKFSQTVIFIISFISVSILAASMFLGSILETFLSINAAAIISFLILLGLGLSFLLEGYIKQLVSKKRKMNEENLAHITISKWGVVVNVFVDCEEKDTDTIKDITFKEAIYLGVALSLDSLGVGFGSAIGNVNFFQVVCFSFLFSILAIPLGLFLGKKFQLYSENIRTLWISGTILIILGISKLT